MGIFTLLSMHRHTYNEYKYIFSRASLVAHLVKNPPAMQETWVQTLGWEDPLEKGTATHLSIIKHFRLFNLFLHKLQMNIFSLQTNEIILAIIIMVKNNHIIIPK